MFAGRSGNAADRSGGALSGSHANVFHRVVDCKNSRAWWTQEIPDSEVFGLAHEVQSKG